MINRRNYYRILHVQPDAPTEIIKASYRTLMSKLKQHPDLGGDHDTAVLINEAYEALADPARRETYDRVLLQAYGVSQLSGNPLHKRRAGAGAASPATAANNAADAEISSSRLSRRYRPIIKSFCPFCMTPNAIEPHAAQAAEFGGREESAQSCKECDSPLQSACHVDMNTGDQRSVHRTPVSETVYIYDHWPQNTAYRGTLSDLSLNGISILCDQRLQVSEPVKLKCVLFESIVRIAYCNADGGRYHIGAEFVTLRFLGSRGSFFDTSI